MLWDICQIRSRDRCWPLCGGVYQHHSSTAEFLLRDTHGYGYERLNRLFLLSNEASCLSNSGTLIGEKLINCGRHSSLLWSSLVRRFYLPTKYTCWGSKYSTETSLVFKWDPPKSLLLCWWDMLMRAVHACWGNLIRRTSDFRLKHHWASGPGSVGRPLWRMIRMEEG